SAVRRCLRRLSTQCNAARPEPWHRVVAPLTQRVAACEAVHREPAAAENAVSRDGLVGIVGATGQKAARPRKIGGKKGLVASNEAANDRLSRTSGFVGDFAQGVAGSPLQGCSEWR